MRKKTGKSGARKVARAAAAGARAAGAKTRRAGLIFSRRRTTPGAAPGNLVPAPGGVKPVLTAILYTARTIVEERTLESIDELDASVIQGRRLWLDVTGLGDAEVIQKLKQRFDLHPLALEDAIHPHQRPKAEVYPQHLFLVLRMLRPGAETLDTEQVSIFLCDEVVITVQERPGDCFDPVRARLRDPKSKLRHGGSDYLAYALVDAVVDFGFPVLEGLGDRLAVLEEEALNEPHEGLVRDIHSVRRELLGIRRVFWPLREALSTLSRETHPRIRDETRIYLRDTYDHVIQLIDLVETYRELSASLLDVYLTALGQRTNEVMKTLTLVSTIFIPLGFIAGLYGMNFDTKHRLNMPELDWAYGYPFVLAIMSLVAGGFTWWFWRKGWVLTRERPRRSSAETRAPAVSEEAPRTGDDSSG